MQSEISEQTDVEIAKMFKAGISGKLIGHTLGLTAISVFQRIKRMRLEGVDLPPPFAPKLGVASNAEHDPRRASILHLLDLKRAGYSPAQTEYVISAERYSKPQAYPIFSSVYGSPAAACEAS